MAALFHVLMTQTTARSGAPAGPSLSPSQDRFSDRSDGGQEQTFEALISEQTSGAADSNAGTNAATQIPQDRGDIDAPSTPDSAPIIGETPSAANVAVADLDDTSTQLIGADDGNLAAEMARPVVAEPVVIDKTAAIDADLVSAATSPSVTAERPNRGVDIVIPASAPDLVSAATVPVPSVDKPLGEKGKTLPSSQPTPANEGLGSTRLSTPLAAAKPDPSAAPAPPQTSVPDADVPAANVRPEAEPRGETVENRTAPKATAANMTAPTDIPKLADMPTSPSLPSASLDLSTPIKSLPLMSTASPVIPFSGVSDRLAATILQTANAPAPVTLDKMPQAVVAVALSAKSATLQIDPPELGRIQLDYQFDTQGRTVVTLTPESDAARAALMDRMAMITAALEQGSNSPIDVNLADARDFGAAFGQASQGGDGEGSNSGSQDGQTQASSADRAQTRQQFTRTPAGEQGRLHILV